MLPIFQEHSEFSPHNSIPELCSDRKEHTGNEGNHEKKKNLQIIGTNNEKYPKSMAQTRSSAKRNFPN